MEARRLAILDAMGVTAYLERRPTPAAVPGWSELEAEVRDCRLCRLCETRTQTVFGTGDRRARLMVVGEAPGAEEDRQGEPFVGRAGMLLNSMLRAAGSDRCLPYLRRQIELVGPAAILCVGRIAAQRLLGCEETLGRLRGRVHRLGQVPVVVTYHPAYLLRSPGEKRKSWVDLQLALRVLSGHGA
jgi:DNA polymerase